MQSTLDILALLGPLLAGLVLVAYRRERRAAELLREVVGAIPGGVVMWDRHDRLTMCNQVFRDIYALCEPTLTPGASFESIIRFGISQGQYPEAAGREEEFVRDLVQAHRRGSQTAERQLPNGRWILIHEERTPSGHIVAIRSDITAMKAALAAVAEAHDVAHHMAHHDGLTGLPNRVLFNASLGAAIDAYRAGGPGFALLCFDLDRFKVVNDTLGHAGGDELLAAVAERLRDETREGDVVARLGGDEFAMLVIADDPSTVAAVTARRLIAQVGAPYRLMTGRADIGVSVGAVLADATSTREGLMRQADQALYAAKKAGRGCARFAGRDADAEAAVQLGSPAPMSRQPPARSTLAEAFVS